MFSVYKTTLRGQAFKTRGSTATILPRLRTVWCCSCFSICIAMHAEQPTVLLWSILRTASLVKSSVGLLGIVVKNELMDAILREFADDTSLKEQGKHDFAGLC